VAAESFPVSSGVPVPDGAVGLVFGPGGRCESTSGIDLVPSDGPHTCSVAALSRRSPLVAHGLSDAGFLGPSPPPAVLVLPAHIGVRDRAYVLGQLLLKHDQEPLLLRQIGVPQIS
jgi:hypothetical protein